ncbi:hypothetical protein [Alteromonas sp. KUL49]|uniref:hypothetical protein n=1 Tax=Alteromonas sp. KUL49 TaxID=2480798 RepID=UPI00102F0843|nr:hypothetical protein [Alteromonas sp. KUL49]TAP41237.1 hypothetical protein EYS00_03290 [Alteromonas sp. KUL49]GEA10286.1 hypothetical protein KUL49_06610 [Alteromonas sp. KUL49]
MGNKNRNSDFVDRRRAPKTRDAFYKVAISLNFMGWAGLVLTLILFHFARPDFVSGVQNYYGIAGSGWSPEYVLAMTRTLQVCIGLSVLGMYMRSRRSRRKSDRFGANLFVLCGIAVMSLMSLASA